MFFSLLLIISCLARGPPADSSSLSEVFCPPAAPPHGPDAKECVGGATDTHREGISNQYVRSANLTIGALGLFVFLTQSINRNAVRVIPAVCDTGKNKKQKKKQIKIYALTKSLPNADFKVKHSPRSVPDRS